MEKSLFPQWDLSFKVCGFTHGSLLAFSNTKWRKKIDILSNNVENIDFIDSR